MNRILVLTVVLGTAAMPLLAGPPPNPNAGTCVDFLDGRRPGSNHFVRAQETLLEIRASLKRS